MKKTLIFIFILSLSFNAVSLPIAPPATGIGSVTDITGFFTGSGDYLKADGTTGTPSGSGDLVSTNNLSDLTNDTTALNNLFAAGYTWEAVALDLSAATITFGLEAGDIPDISATYQPLLTNPVVQGDLGSNVFTFLGTPTSANLFSAVSDEGDFISTLWDDADSSVARTTLGLVIGTDVLAPDGIGTLLTALNGENIQDDTIDDDSIDFTDVTYADFGDFDPDDLSGDSTDDNLVDYSIILPPGSDGQLIYNNSGALAGTSTIGIAFASGTSSTGDAVGEPYVDTNGDGSTISTMVFDIHDGSNQQHFFPADAFPTADDQILKYDAATHKLVWEADAGAAGGDSVSIDSVGVTDPDFVSTGDIDFVDTSNTITANINEDSVDPAHMANGDFGDFTVASNVATLDTGVVTANEIGAIALQKEFTFLTPADADDCLLFKAQRAITITDIHCIIDPTDTGESISVEIYEYDGTGDNGATVDAAITADNDGAEDDGSLTNGAIDAGDWVGVLLGTPSGTVSQLCITIYYTEDI